MTELETRTAISTANTPAIDPLPAVRQAVRALLLASPAYHELDADRRRQLAELMVRVCHTGAALILEELESDQLVQTQSDGSAPVALAQAAPGKPLALAQNAGREFSGVSAARVAETTRNILNAVSFPRFVAELINGVFKAIVDTNIQQMNSFVELLNNVAASTEGFADSNLGPDRARAWLAERYPAFELTGESEDEGWGDEPPEPTEQRLRLRPGASMPSPEALRVDLGLEANESVPTGDPEALVPLARRRLAKTRQEVLATMVMLGLQRIVIDGGKINAAMRFHIDTRSAAQTDAGSTFDFRHQSSGSAKFGVGAWGFSAAMTNTIGYVSTQRTQTTEEMNTDLDLSSAVELIFRTDQVPLNRMANATQITQIMANSRNPEAEIASRERTARAERAARGEEARSRSVEQILTPRPSPPPTPPALDSGSPSRPDPQPAGSTARPGTPNAGRPPNPGPAPATPNPGGSASPATRPAAPGNSTTPSSASAPASAPATGNPTAAPPA